MQAEQKQDSPHEVFDKRESQIIEGATFMAAVTLAQRSAANVRTMRGLKHVRSKDSAEMALWRQSDKRALRLQHIYVMIMCY